jgi:hypothetical protein
LPGDELATPLLATLECLAEPALVGPDGEEADDDHPERDTDHQSYKKRVHDRRPFPPLSG